ncbi:hypothetical protein MBLNU459_g1667t1 [Dothideomycetes sp. NU459]
MAIFPTLIADGGADSSRAIDIEAWTVEQAAERLRATRISSPPSLPRSTATVSLEIPLDDDISTVAKDPATPRATPRTREAVHTVYRRHEPIRRDSQKRREALLKGKEGSRRRQRWENDRLLNNPYAQPPLPSDWEVRPTYPVHSVPYFLAPLWDAELKAKAARHTSTPKKPTDPRAHGSAEEQAASRIPAELRAKLKKSRGAKGLLQDLEEEVRGFVEAWEAKEREMEKEGLIDGDSEDEEIVFVGRNGAMSDERRREREQEELRRDKMVYQSLVDDHGAAFGRWLVHSIATYYGLETWSVTTGSPPRREAYIGLKASPKSEKTSPLRTELPRPLWGLI